MSLSAFLRLFALVAVISYSSWLISDGVTNARMLVAAAPAGGGVPASGTGTSAASGSSAPVNAADQQNDQCPKETSWLGYNSSKKYMETYCGGPSGSPKPPSPQTPPASTLTSAVAAASCSPPNVMKVNAYGRPCVYKHSQSGFVVDAICVAEETCQATHFTGMDGKKYPVVTSATQVAGPGAGTNRVVDLGNTIRDQLAAPIPEPPPVTSSGGGIVRDPLAPAVPAPTRASPPSSAPSNPYGSIGQIANGGSNPGGGGGSQLPKPALITPSVFSNFVNTIAGSGGSGGSYAQGSYGSPSLPPAGPSGYNNRNFDVSNAQTTFSPVGPSTYDSIGKLAVNDQKTLEQVIQNAIKKSGSSSKGPTAAEIAAEIRDSEIRQESVVNDTFSRATNSFSEGLADLANAFVESLFGVSVQFVDMFPKGPSVEERLAAEAGVEGGGFTLTSSKDILIAGDPESTVPASARSESESDAEERSPFNAASLLENLFFRNEASGGGGTQADFAMNTDAGGSTYVQSDGEEISSEDPQVVAEAAIEARLAEEKRKDAKDSGILGSTVFTLKTAGKFFAGLVTSFFSGFADLFR